MQNGNGFIVLILVILLVVALVFMAGRCRLSCNMVEGYERSILGNDCYGLQRTPVDFAFKNPYGWQRNPHWRADPSDEYQPLDYGPIDFYSDRRRLNATNGVLFQQYRNDWRGCGRSITTLRNDEKNRFDLTNVGDQGARVQLDGLYNPRFGPRGITHTERSYDEPNPFFDKIYGGVDYLVHDKLGD